MTKATKITAVQFPDGETHAYRDMWHADIANGRAKALHGKEGVAAVKEWQRVKLLEIVEPGTRLTVIATHQSASGGSSRFRVFVAALDDNGKPYVREITGDVAAFAGFQRHRSTGDIVMTGYGYSKSFQIGYSLGRALWPNGTPEPHGTRNGTPDNAGGYALKVN